MMAMRLPGRARRRLELGVAWAMLDTIATAINFSISAACDRAPRDAWCVFL